MAFFKKHWFLVGLVLLVGGGLSVGLMLPGEVVDVRFHALQDR